MPPLGRLPLLSLLAIALIAPGALRPAGVRAAVGCEVVQYQEDAQALLDANPDNRATMDPDGDGIACEEKPTRSGKPPRPSTSGSDDDQASDSDTPKPAPKAKPKPKPAPAPAAPLVSGFPNILDADVDLFWARMFAAADLPYAPPAGIVGFDASVETECGWADAEMSVAFYCPLDETIYYSNEFRAIVEERVGDFAWITVIAHEWGHHVQVELGLDEQEPTRGGARVYPIQLELQADCLAGAYAQDAEGRDWLDPGDLEEALFLTDFAGDEAGTHWTDPGAHGTPQQRVRAFERGYDEGLPGCDLDL